MEYIVSLGNIVMGTYSYIQLHWVDIAKSIAELIGVASFIVKATPTLKDDALLLPVVKFIGKYIALNKTVTDTDRPK
jgi:hypothetical protein